MHGVSYDALIAGVCCHSQAAEPEDFDMSCTQVTFASSTELAAALRRAEAAHAEHEKRTGQQDANWPDWYAEYIVREQTGKPLPS
jgi:hypothetical protein